MILGRWNNGILGWRALALAAVAVLLFAMGSASAETWHDANRAFALEYPDGWRTEGGADGTDRYFAAYGPDGATGISVRAVPLPAGVDVTELRQVYEQSRLASATAVDEAQTQLAGHPAQHVLYRLHADGQVLELSAVYAKAEDVGYVLTRVAPQGGSIGSRAAADAALASLRIPGATHKPDTRHARGVGETVALASGARINAPPGWTATPENGANGEGAILLMAPDERAAIGVNILRMAEGAPLAAYASAIESEAFSGAALVKQSTLDLNGLVGSMRMYNWRQDGKDLKVSAFFAEQERMFVTVWSTTETDVAGMYRETIVAAIESFRYPMPAAPDRGGAAAELVFFDLGPSLKTRFDLTRAKRTYMADAPQIVAAFKLEGGARPVRLSLHFNNRPRPAFSHELSPQATGRHGLREGVMTWSRPTAGWPVGFYQARLELSDGKLYTRDFIILPLGGAP